MQSFVDEAVELLRHAEELQGRGHPEAAAAIASSIAERTGEPGDDSDLSSDALASLLLRLGKLLRALGLPERAAAVLSRAARRFERSASLDGPGLRSSALREQGRALRDLGRLEEAEAALREALDGDLSFAEVSSIVRSLQELADVLAALGKFSSAIKCYEWAVQQATALEDRELEADVRLGHGEMLLAAGRADIAFLKLWRAFQLFRFLGDDDRLAIAARDLGEVALAGGRGSEARQSFSQVISLGQQNERPSLEALGLVRRAAAHRADDLLAASEADLRAALALVEPRETEASELPEVLRAFVPPPAALLAACAHELGFTLALSGSLTAAEDLAHRALQMRSRRRDPELWKTCALLARVATARGEVTLARTWEERAAAAYRPSLALARAGGDVAAQVDALRPLFAAAQAARRSIDPWVGGALSFGGPVPHEAELRLHLAALADRDAGAPIPSADLPPSLARAIREAWRLGPWPEDDLLPDPAGD